MFVQRAKGGIMAVFLGLAATALTTGCWLPQLLRAWQTRSTGDLSWLYLSVLGMGITLWLLYGVAVGDPVIITANALTITALTVLAVGKARFDAERARAAG
jgi:MtN3 and saliva related transmembrane protein